PVSSHPSGAQSHRFAAGPGLANIKKIKRLRGGDLQVAPQATVQIDAEIGQKDHFRMESILTQGCTQHKAFLNRPRRAFIRNFDFRPRLPSPALFFWIY
ncbi:hypothetical protein, partial [Desulfatiglans anilini]|uniref:hypothetical protein n=1 Tax=Desulfatiglans anilini TaxID=90728 RepID=UPI00055528C6